MDMERDETPEPGTVTIEEDGVLKLSDREIRHLGGIQPGDKLVFEVVDDGGFTLKKVQQQ